MATGIFIVGQQKQKMLHLSACPFIGIPLSQEIIIIIIIELMVQTCEFIQPLNVFVLQSLRF